MDWFWPNLHSYIVGRRERDDEILVTVTKFSRSQHHFEMSKIWFLCVIFWTSQWILTKLAYIHCLEEGKSWWKFDDLYLIFNVTLALWNIQNMVSMRYLLYKLLDFDQTCIDTLFGGGEGLIRFWWHWLNFQGHMGTLKCQILTKIVFLYDIFWIEHCILAIHNVLYHCGKM